jgi:hypothetical protein
MSDDSLTEFVESICGESHLRVQDDLGDGFVRLRSSEAERRQAAQDIRCSEDIVIEMLRNARDANARNIFVATGRTGDTRRITMIDDGDGVPKHLQGTIFEPRVTSKLDSMHMDKWGVHGRGMALYSISVNAKSAQIASSGPGLGSAFVVESDLSQLPEKTDQSSFPTFELGDSGNVSVRGPKNIIRTSCEFAIESRSRCNVFLGSATEIAACLLAYGRVCGRAAFTLSAGQKLACLREVPICKRLACAADPAAFRAIAESLGLDMSERSARRVLDGTIASIDPLLDRINIKGLSASDPVSPLIKKNPPKNARGLKISDQDKRRFAASIAQAFEDLAADYYLNPNVEPSIRVTKDAIHVVIPVVNDD